MLTLLIWTLLNATPPVDPTALLQQRTERLAQRSRDELHLLNQRISLEAVSIVSPRPSQNLVALDDALESLSQFDARKAKVVELRFFGGLSVEETAEVLKVSSITVMRDWNTARAWLRRELKRDSAHGS